MTNGRGEVPIVVIAGTGTEVGKTHFACVLLRALSREGLKTMGLKPVETGVVGPLGDDAASLERLSTFHVKHDPPPYMLARPVSPHLAAREEGRMIEIEEIVRWVNTARTHADVLVVELAGGLFSPLTPSLSNADLALALRPTATILVAPDRLGVLHDLAATTRAAHAMGLSLTALVLSTPNIADTSTGANAPEVPLVTSVPLLGVLPRAPVAQLDREGSAIAHQLRQLPALGATHI